MTGDTTSVGGVILFAAQELLALAGMISALCLFFRRSRGSVERILSGIVFVEMWLLGALRVGQNDAASELRNGILVVLAIAVLFMGMFWLVSRFKSERIPDS